MPYDDERKPLLCDGCRVKPPLVHQCSGANAFVMGFRSGKSCECTQAECLSRKGVGDGMLRSFNALISSP